MFDSRFLHEFYFSLTIFTFFPLSQLFAPYFYPVPRAILLNPLGNSTSISHKSVGLLKGKDHWSFSKPAFKGSGKRQKDWQAGCLKTHDPFQWLRRGRSASWFKWCEVGKTPTNLRLLCVYLEVKFFYGNVRILQRCKGRKMRVWKRGYVLKLEVLRKCKVFVETWSDHWDSKCQWRSEG